MIVSRQSTVFEAVHNEGESGLVGTIEVRIDDNDGATTFGPTSADIIELGSTGVYRAELTAPGAVGQFSILWSPDGSFDDETTSVEDLLVTEDDPVSALPPLVPSEAGGGGSGPSVLWTTTDAIAECCDEDDASDSSIYDAVAVQASEVLYRLGGRKHAGLSQRKVRPPGSAFGCWDGARWLPWPYRGFEPISYVKLAGRPIRSIVEVKIDGDVVDAETYKLFAGRLARVRDPDDPDTRLTWPTIQRLDLEDTEADTFSITYTHGMEPPAIGQAAAAELACHLYRACTGEGECALPAGTVKVERNNATIHLGGFVNWAFDARRGWETGMPLVDVFLNAFNPNGQQRRPAVWSPDVAQFPKAEPVSGS